MSGRKTSNYSYNRQTQERASALVSLQAQQRSLKLLLSTLEGQQKELMDSSQVSISHSGVSIDDWRREVSQATSVISTMLSSTDQLRQASVNCDSLLKVGQQIKGAVAAAKKRVYELESAVIQHEAAIDGVYHELSQWLGQQSPEALRIALRQTRQQLANGNLSAAENSLAACREQLQADCNAAKKKEQEKLYQERVEGTRALAIAVAAVSKTLGDYVKRTPTGLRSTFTAAVAEFEAWQKDTDSFLSSCQISRDSDLDAVDQALNSMRASGEALRQMLNDVFVTQARKAEAECEFKFNELNALHRTHLALLEKWLSHDEVKNFSGRFETLEEFRNLSDFGAFEREYLTTETSLKSNVEEACQLEQAHEKRIYLVSGLIEVCQEMGFSMIDKPRLEDPGNRRSLVLAKFDTGNRGEVSFALSLDSIEVDSCMGGSHCFEEFQKLTEQLRENFGVETQFRGDESFQPRKISKGELDEPVGGSQTAG